MEFIGHQKRQILKEAKSASRSGTHTGRGGLAAILQWHDQLPAKWHQKVEIFDAGKQHITMQNDHMRKDLRERASGLQSDTVEGVIHDDEFAGNIDLHITSCFDMILQGWVPVLISVKRHYAEHWNLCLRV